MFPPLSGHRPVTPGAVSGPHPRRARHHRVARGDGVHHRVRRVRVRSAHTAQLSRRQRPGRSVASRPLENWAADHGDEVICNFGIKIGPNSSIGPNSAVGAVVMNVPCGNGPGGGPATVHTPPGDQGPPLPSHAQIAQAARAIARADYSDYTQQFLYPSDSLMIKSGLWLELEVVIGFVVGLGLGSLIGQRTVAVILMIVLEVDLDADPVPAPHPTFHKPPAGRSGTGHGPSGTGRPPGVRRGRGRPRGRSRESGTGARIHHRGDLRHHRLAGGLVDPRRMADGTERRMNGPGTFGTHLLVSPSAIYRGFGVRATPNPTT